MPTAVHTATVFCQRYERGTSRATEVTFAGHRVHILKQFLPHYLALVPPTGV